MVVLLPSLPASGTLLYRWVDPGGTTRELYSSSAVTVIPGERGLGIPALDLVDDKLPSSAGTALRFAGVQRRTIQLPLRFEAANPSALEGLMDSVYQWFATADEVSKTPGYLQVTRFDGTERQIACYYQSGLEGDFGPQNYVETWREATVTLVAPNPTTTDTADTVHTYTASDSGVDLSVINGGQVDAYPVWTITGPLTALQLTNTTTGEALALTADGGLTLASGEQIIIDTRPSDVRAGLQVYKVSGGTDLFTKLTDASDTWWLIPGQNHFTIAMAGTSGVTRVSLAYLNRYRALR